MYDGDRIPIDISEVTSPAATAVSDVQRTTVREDGTIVIDILATPTCAPSTEGEIVVCAETAESHRLPQGAKAPDNPNLSDRIGEALNVKIGPLQLGSIAKGDGTRAFGAQLKF